VIPFLAKNNLEKTNNNLIQSAAFTDMTRFNEEK
jgi:hypothetical protein